MATTPKWRRRLLRWSVGVLALLALLFLLASVLNYARFRSANSRWERLASEFRSKGHPLTYEEIEASQPDVAEGSNAEVAFRRAAQVLESVTSPGKGGVFVLDGKCERDFFEGIERQCLPPTREYVSARRQALNELYELTRYANERLDLFHERTESRISTNVSKPASLLRTLGTLVSIDGILNIVDGNTDSAVDAAVLQLRLSQPLYAEPRYILLTVGIANDMLAVANLEGLLNVHELSEADLLRLSVEWKRHTHAQSMRASLLGHRASLIRSTDAQQLRTTLEDALARIKTASKRRWKLPNPLDWVPYKDEWFLYENRVQGVTTLSRVIEASDDVRILLDVAK